MELEVFITNGVVSSRICNGRGGFGFEMVVFLFFGGDVPRSPTYCVYISQLNRFASACSNVSYFINRSQFLTAKLLKQSCQCHKICKAFSFLNSTADTLSVLLDKILV